MLKFSHLYYLRVARWAGAAKQDGVSTHEGFINRNRGERTIFSFSQWQGSPQVSGGNIADIFRAPLKLDPS